MSFRAYIDNIQKKTGLSGDDFKRLSDEKGFSVEGKIKPDVKAMTVVKWLKEDHGLGHGHAMAIVCLLQGREPDEG